MAAPCGGQTAGPVPERPSGPQGQPGLRITATQARCRRVSDSLFNATGFHTVYQSGRGRDWMSGQGGDDTYVLTTLLDSKPGSHCDVICDWGFGRDRIDVRPIDANAAAAGNQAFTFVGTTGFSGKPGELRIYLSGGKTVVEADVNADKFADLQIQLNGKHVLSAFDFLL